MIEAHIALVLIVDFIGGAAVVVRSSGGRWQRVAIEQRERHGIHRAPWDRVAGKRRTSRPDSGRGIVDGGDPPADRFREDPLPLQQGWHRRRDRSSNRLTLTLIIREEKRPVFHERPAQHAAVL